MKAGRASSDGLEVAAGARREECIAGFQVDVTFCKSVALNLHAVFPLTLSLRERVSSTGARRVPLNGAPVSDPARLSIGQSPTGRVGDRRSGFRGSEQPSPDFGMFERVRGIAAMVSPFDDEGERISEELTSAVAFIAIQAVAFSMRFMDFVLCFPGNVRKTRKAARSTPR